MSISVASSGSLSQHSGINECYMVNLSYLLRWILPCLERLEDTGHAGQQKDEQHCA